MKTANLTGSLLIRKGLAKPTVGYAPPVASPRKAPESRGWAGSKTSEPAHGFAVDYCEKPQPSLIKQSVGCDKKQETETDSNERVKVTIRMDAEDYKRLKILAVHGDTTLQSLVKKALHTHLFEFGPTAVPTGCRCISNDIKAGPGTNTWRKQ